MTYLLLVVFPKTFGQATRWQTYFKTSPLGARSSLGDEKYDVLFSMSAVGHYMVVVVAAAAELVADFAHLPLAHSPARWGLQS